MRIPVCVTIGSSDPSGGAGIQGDLKAFASVGCWGATVIAGITAQNWTGIQGRFSVPSDSICAQWDSVAAGLPIHAVKVGITWSPEVVETVCDLLGTVDVPVVVDPVMAAASGDALAGDAVRETVLRRYFARATVVTPNLTEARILTGERGATPGELADALVALGARAALVTTGGESAVDYYADADGALAIERAYVPRLEVHGAGCAQSSLTAGLMARGLTVRQAVTRACHLASTGALRSPFSGGAVAPIDVLDLRRLGESVR